jgi:hypothetical protein
MNGTSPPANRMAPWPVWSDRIRPLELSAVTAIARSMRAADRREIFACRFREDPDELAAQVLAVATCGFVAWSPAQPVAVVAAVEAWPGFWRVAMFATDQWPRVAASTTRAVRRAMIPALLVAGGRRAECCSDAEHQDAHRWLVRLGFVPEARLWSYGKRGEDFILFAWRAENVHVSR